MTVKQLVFHLAVMASAYAGVLIVPVIAYVTCNIHSELDVIVWLNVGLFVMQMKKISFPTPSMHHVDTMGGLRLLWWALFWPRYLLRAK
ncbi:hypothetical protein [Massilia sp. TSP1-1-2]|uniref:hypothetical protein n=1 Tax=unclassified Massilia TaxID=2609279 RepID=UPI003CF7F3A2